MALKKPNFLALFMLGSSLLLLYFGIPRFLAELMLVPGTPIIERLNAGDLVSDEDLDVAQQSREQAVSFVDHPGAYSELGTIFLTRARRATDSSERKQFAEQAIQHLETTLSLAPLNTFAWLRLCNVRLLIGGPDNRQKAVEAWRMSVKTARFEPFVLIPRLHTGILIYDGMIEEDHETIRDQAAMAYGWNRHEFRIYMRQKKLIEWAVFLLSDDSEAVDYMNK